MAEDLPPRPGMPTVSSIGQFELTAAARESFGFADDQFMELSTSGASIYALPILSDPSSSSSGSLSGLSGGSSNRSLKRALLDRAASRPPTSMASPGGTTSPRPPQNLSLDESSLSISGMSLASLGSLSRSSRRLHMLENVDEALDDSRSWRDAEVSATVEESDRDHEHNGEKDARSSGGYGRSSNDSDRRQGTVLQTATGGDGSAAAVTAVGLAGTAGILQARASSAPSQHQRVGGNVQDFSTGIADLRRQYSYSRRMASMPQRRKDVPPPPPVGVDLAPVSSPTVISSSPPTQPVDATIGAPTIRSTSHNRDDDLDGDVGVGGSGRGGNGGGTSSGSSGSRSPSQARTGKRKGSRPAAVGRLLRTIGRRTAKAREEVGASGEKAGVIAPGGVGAVDAEGEVEWASEAASWSNNSSVKGRRSNSSPTSALGASPGRLPHNGQAIRARSASSASTAVATPAPAVAGLEKSKLGRGGLRERFASVWGHRHCGSSSKKGKRGNEPELEEMSTSSTGTCIGSGGVSGFSPGDSSAVGPEPGALPGWFRGHSAPVGPLGDTISYDPFSTATFSSVPLAASGLAFDPNFVFSPSAFDVDDSSASAARSFDPNSSVKSLLDMSSSDRRPPDAHDTSTADETDGSSAVPEGGAVQSAQAVAPQYEAAASTAGARDEAAEASAQAAVEAAAALLQEQLAQDLSDLSVSGGGRDDKMSPVERDAAACAHGMMEFPKAGVAALTPSENRPDSEAYRLPRSVTLDSTASLPTTAQGTLSKDKNSGTASHKAWQAVPPMQTHQTAGLPWSNVLVDVPGEKPPTAGGAGGNDDLGRAPVQSLKMASWPGPGEGMSAVGMSLAQWQAGGVPVGGGPDCSGTTSDLATELSDKQVSSSSREACSVPTAAGILGVGRSRSADDTDRSSSTARMKSPIVGLNGGGSGRRSSDNAPNLSRPDRWPYGGGGPANPASRSVFATAPAGGIGTTGIPPPFSTSSSPNGSGSGSVGAPAPLPPPWWPGLSGCAPRADVEVQGTLNAPRAVSHEGSIEVPSIGGDVGGGCGSGSPTGGAESVPESSPAGSEGKNNGAWSALEAMIPTPGLAKPKPNPQAVGTHVGGVSQVGTGVDSSGGTVRGGGSDCGSDVGCDRDGKAPASGWGMLASLG